MRHHRLIPRRWLAQHAKYLWLYIFGVTFAVGATYWLIEKAEQPASEMGP